MAGKGQRQQQRQKANVQHLIEQLERGQSEALTSDESKVNSGRVFSLDVSAERIQRISASAIQTI
jgi:hypothetical protein